MANAASAIGERFTVLFMVMNILVIKTLSQEIKENISGLSRIRASGSFARHRKLREPMPFETPPNAPNPTTPATNPSGFAPLKIPLFRDRWIASTISSVGTWMQDTAGTWLMTSLTASPLLIALMQTAASLPVLLLGLLAGATADIFDRRKLLIFWQTWMLASVGLLAVLTFFGHVSPWALLAFTFLLNIGSAMNNPAWQAIVPELVPRELIPDTVSLNAASNNLARAVGPALGG